MSNPEEKIQEAAENIQDAVSSAKAAVDTNRHISAIKNNLVCFIFLFVFVIVFVT